MNDSPRRDQLDLLIARIADSCATDQDWASFRALADADPSAWKELAHAQREHASLGLAMNLRLHAAERVELPDLHLAAHRSASADHHRRRIGWSRFGSAAGWAAAACVLIAWMGSGNFGRVRTPAPDAAQAAGLIHVGTPEDAASAYVQLGREKNVVLGELPSRVLVETRPTPDGKLEVIYIRQFVERAITDNVAPATLDEQGNPVPVREPEPAVISTPY